MVVDVLVQCGALQCSYDTRTFPTYEQKKITTIQLTPLGRALLEAIAHFDGSEFV